MLPTKATGTTGRRDGGEAQSLAARGRWVEVAGVVELLAGTEGELATVL